MGALVTGVQTGALPIFAIAGACELLGAVGLLIAKTRTAAGLGLFVLTLCVTPVNFNMGWHPEQFPQFHPTFIAVRLALQIPLLAGIWWSTRAPRRSHA